MITTYLFYKSVIIALLLTRFYYFQFITVTYNETNNFQRVLRFIINKCVLQVPLYSIVNFGSCNMCAYLSIKQLYNRISVMMILMME